MKFFFFWGGFLFYGPSTHFRSFRERSVNLANWSWSSLLGSSNQYLVHILSPVTDNCSSWIRGRGRMAVEMLSWPSLQKECAGRGDRTRGRLRAKRTCFRSSYRARQQMKWQDVSVDIKTLSPEGRLNLPQGYILGKSSNRSLRKFKILAEVSVVTEFCEWIIILCYLYF